ncbi:MAG: hypothetical protein RL026_2366 [Pseudomonadota bacterium]|jgi:ribosomal protein L11 methyltransferase
MPFLSLRVALEGRDPEAAEEACFAAGACSVTFTDAVDDAILEPAPGEVRLWPRTVLEAVFEADAAGPETLLMLASALDVPASAVEATHLEDRAWEREWLKDFHAMRFGARLWIVPHHEPLPPDPAAICVRLDPGLAFGTGTHPSTALCLQWLDGHLQPGVWAIDYGCGSGVLAIAAARLGAVQVWAHDIDPQAGVATLDNAAANQVASKVLWQADADALPALAPLLIANIISGVLCSLAPRFRQLLAPGGTLLLAGILEEQAQEVVDCFAPWIALTVWRQHEGWVALHGTRAPPDAMPDAPGLASDWAQAAG